MADEPKRTEILSLRLYPELQRQIRLLRIALAQHVNFDDIPTKTLVVEQAIAFAFANGAAFVRGFDSEQETDILPADLQPVAEAEPQIPGQTQGEGTPSGASHEPADVPALPEQDSVAVRPCVPNKRKRGRPRKW